MHKMKTIEIFAKLVLVIKLIKIDYPVVGYFKTKIHVY